MANAFVIQDSISKKFIERSKVCYWNTTDGLENARTWDTEEGAQAQINNMNRVIAVHSKNCPETPRPVFVARKVVITLA